MRSSVLAALLAPILVAAFAVPAFAQTPPAKPSAKPAAAPAAKAKPKLMTRDELRACLQRKSDNEVEVKAIEADDKVLAAERAAVVSDRDAIKARNEKLTADETGLKAEIDAVAKRGETIKASMKDMKKTEQEATVKAYDAEIAAVNTKADAHNANKRALMADVAVLEEKIEGFNKRKDVLGDRADKLGDLQDAWRNECGNRPYNEDDEKAINKEKAAAAKAAGQGK